MKHTDELRDIRYEGLEWLKSIRQTAQRDNLYRQPPLSRFEGDTAEQATASTMNTLPTTVTVHEAWTSFAIKRDGKVSCHYCDSHRSSRLPAGQPAEKMRKWPWRDDYGIRRHSQ